MRCVPALIVFYLYFKKANASFTDHSLAYAHLQEEHRSSPNGIRYGRKLQCLLDSKTS